MDIDIRLNKYIEIDREKSMEIDKKKEKTARTDVRKGKMAMIASNTSSGSDSDRELIYKFRRRATIFEQLSDSDSMTEDQQNALHRNRMKPTNCFGGVLVSKSTTYYRSNLRTTIRELKGLRFDESHIIEIRKTPFWLMFNSINKSDTEKLMKRCVKHEDNIREIISAFDDLSKSFVMGGELINLCNQDIQLIFGVASGSKPISLKDAEYEVPLWIKHCFGQEIDNSKGPFVLYKPRIYEKLKDILAKYDGTSLLDVACLTHSYFMASLLSPNQNASMAPHLTGYLEKFDEICHYDWCTYIVEMLRSQIMSSKSMKAGGCVMLLPFWLCEHTNLIKPLDNVGFPRFLKWDLNVLNKKLSRVNISDLEPKHVHHLRLKPTSIEKGHFRALFRFWEEENNKQPKTPSKDDVQETMGVSSRGNSLNYFRAEPTHSDSGSGEDVGATVELGTCNEIVNMVVAPSRNMLEYKKIPSTLKEKCSNSELETHGIIQRGSINFVSSPSDHRMHDLEDGPSFCLNISQQPTPAPIIRSGLHRDVSDDRGMDNSNADVTYINDVVDFAVGYGMLNEDNQDLRVQLKKCKRLVVEKDREIESLKLLNSEGFNTRMTEKIQEFLDSILKNERLVQSALHETYLKKKDEEIELLRAENKELLEKLQEMSVTSTTQIFENPDNLARLDTIEQLHITRIQNEELQKENNDLNDTLEIYDAIDNHLEITPRVGAGKIPCAKQMKKNRYLEPSSLTRMVKDRTVKDDRKAIEFMPQPNTIEIIKLDDDDDHPNIKKARQSNTTKYRMDEKYVAVRKTTEIIKGIIKDCWYDTGEIHSVWKSVQNSFADVTILDIINILHHDKISNGVIDAWAELLLKMYKRLDRAKSTIVFSSTCWGLIASSKKFKSNTFCKFIDDLLDKVGDQDVLLFPLLIDDKDKLSRGLKDHWTLLKLDLRTCEWSFFNSMRPRVKDVAGEYLTNSFVVVEYVETRLHETFKKSRADHPLVNGWSKKPMTKACLQQAAGSVDCGVIVCYQIENTITEAKPKMGVFSSKAASEYRAKMVEWFMDPISIDLDD